MFLTVDGETDKIIARNGDDFVTEQEVKDILVKTNAIMDGHFLLTSGLHSPHYVEKFNVLQHPKYTEQLCRAMAEKFKDADIETVVGPVTGGIILAHETAKALDARAIFTERVDGKMTFRRGFKLHDGERVLIVEDIVTTGGSIKEVIDVVKANGGVPVAVSMLVDRSGGKVNFGDVPSSTLKLIPPTIARSVNKIFLSPNAARPGKNKCLKH